MTSDMDPLMTMTTILGHFESYAGVQRCQEAVDRITEIVEGKPEENLHIIREITDEIVDNRILLDILVDINQKSAAYQALKLESSTEPEEIKVKEDKFYSTKTELENLIEAFSTFAEKVTTVEQTVLYATSFKYIYDTLIESYNSFFEIAWARVDASDLDIDKKDEMYGKYVRATHGERKYVNFIKMASEDAIREKENAYSKLSEHYPCESIKVQEADRAVNKAKGELEALLTVELSDTRMSLREQADSIVAKFAEAIQAYGKAVNARSQTRIDEYIKSTRNADVESRGGSSA